MEIEEKTSLSFLICKICDRHFVDRSDLIEHLRNEHETLELASYIAATMEAEEDRDKMAAEFRRKFELLKRELAGHNSER